MKALALLAIAMTFTLLSSCSQEADLVPEKKHAAGTSGTATRANAPSEPGLHAFALGTKLGPSGGIASGAGETTFEIGQYIYVAMRLHEVPVGTAVRVVWRGPLRDEIGQETKTVRPGQDFMHFAADSGNLLEGKHYSVEVWLERTNVSQLEFDVIG